jgi:hypothetical protein
MNYGCPSWEHAADAHLLKLKGLQNKVILSMGNLDRRTPVRSLRVAFKIPYLYDYIIKFCSKPEEAIQNHRNSNWHAIAQGEAMHRKYRVFRTQVDWTFKLPSEFPAKELRHLSRKMPPRGTTYWEAPQTSDKPAQWTPCIRGLNLVVVRLTTVQVTNCRFGVFT